MDDLLYQHFPQLQFSGATINAGPQAVSEWHRDCQNLAWGLCAIFVTGRFDHKKHGQLLLREPKVILTLQRGDLVFFPSAVITHRNMPLAEGELRRSLVFYSGGGLFRWIAQGHMTERMMASEDKTWKVEGNGTRWEEGWSFFMTLDQLLQHKK